ncbi:hypothetical protein [Natrinema amylolyticum]|uniref:hypothetical protein n=1 Tax=Natrinema amylolyticum TaxID=2878679 RepID=UPI001CFB4B84|nr:hypothetical protein [Natrinema amylolyticum]
MKDELGEVKVIVREKHLKTGAVVDSVYHTGWSELVGDNGKSTGQRLSGSTEFGSIESADIRPQ